MQGYVLVMVLDDAYNLAYVHQAVTRTSCYENYDSLSAFTTNGNRYLAYDFLSGYKEEKEARITKTSTSQILPTVTNDFLFHFLV